MAAAKKGVVSILVDCNWGRKNQKLSTKYGIRGYPTLIFVDKDGDAIAQGSRQPEKLASQFEKYAKAAE